MAWVTREVWVDDAELADQQAAERRGEMTAAEACRILDCSRSRLHAMARQFQIGHDHRLGRDWYSAYDVHEIAAGRRPWEERRRRHAEMMAELPPKSEPPSTQPADPGMDFLAKFSGGR